MKSCIFIEVEDLCSTGRSRAFRDVTYATISSDLWGIVWGTEVREQGTGNREHRSRNAFFKRLDISFGYVSAYDVS